MDPVAAYTAHSVREINDLLTEVRVTIPRAAGRLAELVQRVMVDEYNRGLNEGIEAARKRVADVIDAHEARKAADRRQLEARVILG